MALAPRTVLTYPLDGANRDFQIPFEYLARKFVQVTLIGQDRKVLTLNIDYRFTQRTVITLTRAWGPGDDYTLLEIRRFTSASERLVDFSDGSILRAYDLNTSQVQSLHIAEEGRDIATDTIGVNNEGNLDARGRRIVNLGDATKDGDAVTLRQQRGWGASALNQADRSKAEADKAKVSADSANTSNNSAGRYASTAGGFATDAENSNKAAGVSAGAAKDSEGAAKRSEDLAKEFATNPVNVPIQGNLYSALHWASKSGASAKSAAHSANSASTSEKAAKDSETVTQKNADTVLANMASYGANPVGTVVLGVKDSLPGYLVLAGGTFSKLKYPELFEYLGTETLPDMRGRYPKGASLSKELGAVAEGAIPAHTHTTPAHTHTGSTAGAGGHAHTVSGKTQNAGAHSHSIHPGAPSIAGKGSLSYRSNDSDTVTRTSTEGDHSHPFNGTTSPAVDHAHTVTISSGGGGTTGSFGSGSKVEVDRIGFNFFIKATDPPVNTQLNDLLARIAVLEAKQK